MPCVSLGLHGDAASTPQDGSHASASPLHTTMLAGEITAQARVASSQAAALPQYGSLYTRPTVRLAPEAWAGRNSFLLSLKA